jgi:hypothetical protein
LGEQHVRCAEGGKPQKDDRERVHPRFARSRSHAPRVRPAAKMRTSLMSWRSIQEGDTRPPLDSTASAVVIAQHQKPQATTSSEFM